MELVNATAITTAITPSDVTDEVNFHSLQYALFTTNFVEVLGGLFFLLTALYIISDKREAERTATGKFSSHAHVL
jgi:hypothetical protein